MLTLANGLSDMLFAVNLYPGTHQYNIIPTLEHHILTVTSEENGGHVDMVYGGDGRQQPQSSFHEKHI